MPLTYDWNHLPDVYGDTGGLSADGAGQEQRFLRLKRELHEQLITKLDLSAIGRISEEAVVDRERRARVAVVEPYPSS